MRRRQGSVLLMGAVAFAALLSSPAEAQAPDVRNIRPTMLVGLDTSGSMERLPGCACRTAACTECLPRCNPGDYQRNRWSMMLEALTGGFTSYTCSSEERVGGRYRGEPDSRYYLPHIDMPLGVDQLNNGILDVYVDRVKFGLMTFDTVGTLVGQPALIPASVYRGAGFLSDASGPLGEYSYGRNREFMFPGCGEPYMLNNGARNEGTHGGALISVGGELDDHRYINQLIQESLLQESGGFDALRPHGATPIAGMLDDIRYYYNNHPDVRGIAAAGATGDPFYACRPRYAVILTDGYPNADMRGAPYFCESLDRCPYQTPAAIANALCQYNPRSSACEGVLDGVFVVGFDVDDADAADLDAIADAGGTGEAYRATDVPSLLSALGAILDAAAPGTTTRTVPAFTNTATSGGSTTAQAQYNTGFVVSEDDETPWEGRLDRVRFECDGTDVNREWDPDEVPADEFHRVLNERSEARRIWTVVPTGRGRGPDTALHGDAATSSGIMDGIGVPTLTPIGARATGRIMLEPGSEPTATVRGHLGRDPRATVDWLHGEPGTAREGRRFGDIYHSSPVVIGPPSIDIEDDAFNAYRERPDIATRPTVLYVGTNDGLLHAFAVGDAEPLSRDGTDHTDPLGVGTVTAGKELWAFLPPMVMPKLDDAMASHQWMVDGTPVVKEVFLGRLPGGSPDPDTYHTILLIPLRGGGNAILALDVTDPLDPQFLWQFTDRDMGSTYGQPAMGQVLVQLSGVTHERAIAILPGGQGFLDTSRTTGPIGCPARGRGMPPVTDGTIRARSVQRCWRRMGRQSWIVDLASGNVLRHLDEGVFPAPMNGGVSLHSGDTGRVATRAYTINSDGVLWRFDMSSTNPSDWDAAAFHDLMHDFGAGDGQPGPFAPIVSTNSQGEVVILAATGDMERLDDTTARNVVASITETVTYTDTGAVDEVTGRLNWEVTLEPGEIVTGPLELFESKVYWGSFITANDPTNACLLGGSRIWGVEYIESDGTDPVGAIESPAGSGTFVTNIDFDDDSALSNAIVMGVRVAQRPSCVTSEVVTETDPYLPDRAHVNVTDVGPPQFELVAQLSGTEASISVGDGNVGEFTRELAITPARTEHVGITGSVD